MSVAPAGRTLRRDAAENRERIIVAAARVFAGQNLDAGVEQIAQAADVGMGTLYRHFDSKQALIDEIVGRMRLDLLALAERAEAIGGAAGFEALIFGAGELQAAQPGCLAQLWTRSPAERRASTRFRSIARSLLAAAQAEGAVRKDVVVTDVLMVLWSLRGIIDLTRSAAPDAWRRHLELQLAGFRPSPPEQFRARPMSDARYRRVLADDA